MNGWTNRNNNLRQKVVQALNKDILCICETHLPNSESLNASNYKWFGFNRVSKHIRSPVTFCGVGILVKNNLFSTYLVTIVDKTVNGILGVKFQCKETDYSFLSTHAIYHQINHPGQSLKFSLNI